MREQLQQVMRTPEVLLIGLNGVIGGGIFLLPGQVAELSGSAALWAYLVAGSVALLIGLSYAEVSTMYTRTGGPLVYATEAMGRTAGFTVGWMTWLTYVAGWALLANGFMNYLGSLWPGAEGYSALVIGGIIVLLCGLNTLGVRLGVRIVSFFALAKLIPLVILVFVGLTWSGNASLELVPPGSGDFFGAVLLLIFAYGGFEAATIPAGEMVNPRRTIFIAVLGTIAAVTAFYMLIQYASLRINPELAATEAPLASVGEAMFAGGLILMTVGALVSIGGTQSGVALTAPRNVYGLAREGMLPSLFGWVSPRFKTPVVSIWLTGLIVLFLTVTGTFTGLILLNVAARLYQYMMVCLSAVILRFRDPDRERPFRLPFGFAVPLLAAALCLFLLAQQDIPNLLAAVAALAIGLALYAATQLFRSRAGEAE